MHESLHGSHALRDLAACQGGRRVVVREVPREEVLHPSGVTYWNLAGAGSLVAFDGSLTELERLDLAALVERQRFDALQARRLRVVCDIRGWAVALHGRDRIVECGFGRDEEGRSRTGESWSSLQCVSARLFSDAAYHPGSGDLVFVEEAGPVQTTHASINWPDVAAYGAVMDDEIIAAIGPKFLYVFDRSSARERLRLPLGPGYSVCLLPGARLAVLADKKPRLRILDATGRLLLGLEAQAQLTAKLTVSPSGVLTLVAGDRVAFVDPDTGRVATLPGYGQGSDTQPGQFAWLDATRAAVVWPGTSRLSVIEIEDVFALPAARWKLEKLTAPVGPTP